jgi:hypothetical protein
VLPFEERSDNIIEIFNESCVLLLMSTLITYTDNSNIDPQTASSLGFVQIGLILFNIAFNVMLFLASNLMLLYRKAFLPLIDKCKKRQ